MLTSNQREQQRDNKHGSTTQKRLLRSISKLFSSSKSTTSTTTTTRPSILPSTTTISSINSTGADTDASIRPISPSTSFSPSFVNSTYSHTTTNSLVPTTTDTFKSTTSTKPTTVISLEVGPATTNRIAIVPGAIPSNSINQTATTTTNDSLLSTINVPHHTYPHPRNNPHPASPPPDNASMLTLASSSFAPSISHQSITHSYAPPSVRGPIANLKSSNLSIAGTTINDADEDASVRALAPSRRGSDDSLGAKSTWSAAVLNPNKTASLRTVGTGGTGGTGGERWLGIVASASSTFGLTTSSSSNNGLTVGETEAQKVARQEGGLAAPSPLKGESIIAGTSTPTSMESSLLSERSSSNQESKKVEGEAEELEHPMLPPPTPTHSTLASSSIIASDLNPEASEFIGSSKSIIETSTTKPSPAFVDNPPLVGEDVASTIVGEAEGVLEI